jgi:hypothetical protein
MKPWSDFICVSYAFAVLKRYEIFNIMSKNFVSYEISFAFANGLTAVPILTINDLSHPHRLSSFSSSASSPPSSPPFDPSFFSSQAPALHPPPQNDGSPLPPPPSPPPPPLFLNSLNLRKLNVPFPRFLRRRLERKHIPHLPITSRNDCDRWFKLLSIQRTSIPWTI